MYLLLYTSWCTYYYTLLGVLNIIHFLVYLLLYTSWCTYYYTLLGVLIIIHFLVYLLLYTSGYQITSKSLKITENVPGWFYYLFSQKKCFICFRETNQCTTLNKMKTFTPEPWRGPDPENSQLFQEILAVFPVLIHRCPTSYIENICNLLAL